MFFETIDCLNPEFVMRIRTGNNRKANNWFSDYPSVQLTEGEVFFLGGIHDLNKDSTPLDDFEDEKLANQIFVARVKGKTFLVNTEGYNYARYFDECDIVPSRLEVSDNLLDTIVATAEVKSGFTVNFSDIKHYPVAIEARIIGAGLDVNEIVDYATKLECGENELDTVA